MATPVVPLPETFAELHARIGGVPLDRIRMRPFPGSATEQDVIAALEGADKRLYELVDGVLVEKAMGTREALLASWIQGQLWEYLRENDLGVVLGGDGAVRLMPGNIRYPDVSFIPWSRVPGDDSGEKIWSVTPALAVEVLSASNTKAEIDRKLRDLFSTGCKLAWVIDPEARTARVHTSPAKARELADDGLLDGGRVLPGFKLSLADVFAATTRRKKKPR